MSGFEDLDLDAIRDLDEPAIRDFYAKLIHAKERAVADLQGSVFTNYAEFVVISKEIAKLESEMLQLREVLSGIKRTGDALLSGDSKRGDASGDRGGVRQSTYGLDWKKAQESTKSALDGDLKWMVDVLDQFDIHFAHREFEMCVALVEKARQGMAGVSRKAPEHKELDDRQKTRVERIATVIKRDFKNPISSKAQLDQKLNWLLRLGLQDQARESFLVARSSIIRQRVSQLAFDGSVTQYARELAVVVFTMIRNTANWYQKAFKDPLLASSFMKWVKQEIEFFAEQFRKRVFFEQQKFHVIAASVQGAFEQCLIMREAGLDMKFLVERLFHRNVADSLDVYIRICVDSFPNSWKRLIALRTPLKVGNDQVYQVSNCTVKFYDIVMDLERDIRMLHDLSLYDKIVDNVVNLLEGYVKSIIAFYRTDIGEDDRFVLLLGDMRFVLEFLIPFMSGQLSDVFARPIQEIPMLKKRARQFHGDLVSLFCEAKTPHLIASFDFSEHAYAAQEGPFDVPSDRMYSVVNQLQSLAAKTSDSPVDKNAVLFGLLRRFFAKVLKDTGPKELGYAGVQRLVLDIHFLLKVGDRFIDDDGSSAANAICETALRGFFGQNKENTEALQAAEWYSEKVDQAIATGLGERFDSFK